MDKIPLYPNEIQGNQPVGRLAEVKEAVKTSNSPLSAYADTVKGELRSKSKRLALQGSAGVFCNDANVFFLLSNRFELTNCQKLRFDVWRVL